MKRISKKALALVLATMMIFATCLTVQIAVFSGQQGRIFRPDRATLNGQPISSVY